MPRRRWLEPQPQLKYRSDQAVYGGARQFKGMYVLLNCQPL